MAEYRKRYGHTIVFSGEPDEETKKRAIEEILRDAEKNGIKAPQVIYMMGWEGETE